MSARTRELWGLVVAGLIASVALASVTIAREPRSRAGRLPGACSSSRPLRRRSRRGPTHGPVRRRRPPAADRGPDRIRPRLDLPARPDDGGRQALWVAVGVAVLVATLVWLRHDYRVLESYRYVFASRRWGCSCFRPSRARRTRQRRAALGRPRLVPVPARRAREDLPHRLPRGLPAREARGARAGRLKDFGPLVVIWGAAMLVIVQTNDLGSALLNFGIFLAMLYVATGRPSTSPRVSRSSPAGAPSPTTRIQHVHDRVTIWLHPWTDERVSAPERPALEYRQDCARTNSKSLYSIANGGFGGTGLGDGTFTSTDGHSSFPPCAPTSSSPRSHRSSDFSALPRSSSSSCCSSCAGCGSRCRRRTASPSSPQRASRSASRSRRSSSSAACSGSCH